MFAGRSIATLAQGLEARCSEPAFQRRSMIGIVALGFVLRLLAAMLLPDQSSLLPDALTYRQAAGELISLKLISSDLVMPGYPLLLAIGGGGATWQLIADVLVSTLAVWLVHWLAKEITGDACAALLAALAWAVYPFSLFYAGVGLTETLFVTLLLAAYLGLYRRRYASGSLALVAAILTRPSIELLAPVLVAAFALVVHRGGMSELRRAAMALGLVYVVAMLPWWMHNEIKYGRFVRLNLGGGLVLYAGNNPLSGTGEAKEGIDYDLSGFSTISDPVARDRALAAAALGHIREDPRRFLEHAAVRLARFWRPWPNAGEYRHPAIFIVSAATLVPLYLLAGAGSLLLLRRRPREIVPPLLLVAYLTAIHAVTIGSLRYRFPVEPFLVILTGPAVAALVRRRGER